MNPINYVYEKTNQLVYYTKLAAITLLVMSWLSGYQMVSWFVPFRIYLLATLATIAAAVAYDYLNHQYQAIRGAVQQIVWEKYQCQRELNEFVVIGSTTPKIVDTCKNLDDDWILVARDPPIAHLVCTSSGLLTGNLRGASLTGNLRGASLTGNLRGASLTKKELQISMD
jgi:hypothetical protein